MAIRARIHQRFTKLPYHRLHGSFANPPHAPGEHGLPFNGAVLCVTRSHPRFPDQTIILGWSYSRRHFVGGDDSSTIGVWVCTRLGVQGVGHKPVRRGLVIIDQRNDWKYVGEAEDHLEASDMLQEAFEELHDTVLP